MVKTGFRGERKGNLTPALSKGEGNVVTEKIMKHPPLHIPSCRWLP